MRMINIKCEKCGNEEFVMKPSATGAMVGAYCKLCGKYIKWLSKEEVKQVQKAYLNSIYGVMGTKSVAIKVKYIKDVEPLKNIEQGNWVDLRCSEDITLKQGEFKYIPLGVAIQLPKNHEALVAPRSSTFKNFGLIQTNSIGIIDETYCGDNDEWHMPVLATRDVTIHKNTRIAQFRVLERQPRLTYFTVQTLGNPDRGGLGSTGTQHYIDTDSIMLQKECEPFRRYTEYKSIIDTLNEVADREIAKIDEELPF